MSRLADLIEELCPDGVEYRALGDVAELKRGQAVTRKEIMEGQVPVIAGGREPAYYIDRSNRQGETIVIAGSGAYAGFVSFWNEPIFVSDAFSVVVDSGTLQPRFVYHWLCGRQEAIHALKSGGGVPHVYPKDVAKLRCPIPPLEVQREIARILDQFTTLEAELEAELEARRAQYEHYRNHLLSYDSLAARGPVEMVKLGDVIAISRGASPRPISKFVTQGEGIPWIKIGDVDPRGKFVTSAAERITSAGAEKSRKVLPGDFILSNSMSFGRPYILQIEGCVHDGWLILSNVADHWIPDFLYHSLRTDNVQHQFAQLASGGAVRNLNSRVIESVELALPQKVVQEEIVSVLDRFDALVNDISSGLPAEIAARSAQYEHYRDRLLSFPEKGVSGSDAS